MTVTKAPEPKNGGGGGGGSGGCFISTYSGRYGISQALRLLGVRSGEEVLVPRFHCLAMVQPILAYGCKLKFYKVDSNLQVRRDEILKAVGQNTRGVLLVHYFGIYQSINYGYFRKS